MCLFGSECPNWTVNMTGRQAHHHCYSNLFYLPQKEYAETEELCGADCRGEGGEFGVAMQGNDSEECQGATAT